MSYASEAATIRSIWESRWSEDVAVQLVENSEFEKPRNASWARVLIRGDAAVVASVGGPTIRYRHPGTVIVEIFVPLRIGDGLALELGEAAATVFRGQESGGIRFWAPRVLPQGEVDGWYKVSALAPFSRDTDYTFS